MPQNVGTERAEDWRDRTGVLGRSPNRAGVDNFHGVALSPRATDQIPITSAPAAREIAELYLRAGAIGAPCSELAMSMAQAVLEEPVVSLAQAVLGGGEHAHARATELAGALLGGDEPAVNQKTRVARLKQLEHYASVVVCAENRKGEPDG